MNLEFDTNGNLKPYEVVACDLQTLESVFVDYFPNSESRRKLFNNYLRYIHEFRSRITRHFTQWINGSFISQKENPNDIDFVTFFDYKIYQTQEQYLDRFWTFSLEEEGLDAYLVKVYPEKHKLYSSTKSSLERWQQIYGTTSPNNSQVTFPKGFIELKFN